MLWLIVDDCSTDGTAEALDDAAATTPGLLVHHRRPPEPTLDRSTRIAGILREGIERAEVEVRRLGAQVDCWATLDADVLLPPEYFCTLRGAFEADPRLGICSGTPYYGAAPAGWRRFLDLSDEEPSGAARLWRAACLQDIGGIPGGPAWDVISNAQAALRGWRVRRLWGLRYRTRRMFVREGEWSMQIRGGEQTAQLGYPFSFAILRAARLFLSRNGVLAAPFLAGYLRARRRGFPPIGSSELHAHFRKRTGAATLRARLRQKTSVDALRNPREEG